MLQRILVVEDERDVRECFERLLALLPDCRVESAATFAEGSRRSGESWDLVISDFFLPDGNGVDLLRRCADAHPGTPRVLMSAFEDHPQVAAALDGPGAVEFLQKPFEPEAVLDRVQALLRRTAPGVC